MHTHPVLVLRLALVLLALVASGCSHRLSKSTDSIAPEVPLSAAERGGALIYRSADSDSVQFKSFHLPPARIHRGEDSRFADISEAEKAKLAARLRDSFAETLAKGYPVVSTPAPDTLTLQLTLVDVTTSVPVLSTALRAASPISLAISAGQSAFGSSAALTGAVRVAGEIYASDGRLVGAFIVSEHPLAIDLRSGLTKLYATEIAIDQVAANFKRAVDRSLAQKNAAR
ncbi:MAG: DUF3313 domain-containing protein [Opitutaceae bacterium]|jgi:hypothetical protein|nr:DUF3313 domain-containing protein [Opitutaceae bacterium]